MDGNDRSFHLGHGLQYHGNLIHVDIDPSTVLPVIIQNTTTEFRYSWISTENTKDKSGVAVLMHHFMTKAYAIVPEHLPKIPDLDKWGRLDIEDQAARWPDNLEAAYDLFFLRYCEVTPPQQPCVST
jgi:hypothetical protein